MKRKHKRLTFVFISFGLFSIALSLVLIAFEENIVFFYTPSELKLKAISSNQQIRIGGLVKTGSIIKHKDENISFIINDLNNDIEVRFTGILPDLFREGQGVVAEGVLKDKVFFAREILAKHDENYMPPEVADAIKKSGQWQGAQ